MVLRKVRQRGDSERGERAGRQREGGGEGRETKGEREREGGVGAMNDCTEVDLPFCPIAVTALSSSDTLSLICATCDPSSSSLLLSSDPKPTTEDTYMN